MNARSGKAKAVLHQNEIRDYLRMFLCPPLHEEDILSRQMGGSGSDIILTPAAKNIIPFHIECKRHEDTTWQNTYKSAYQQTFKENFPLLIRRKSHSKNHFYARLHEILEIHPDILKDQKITMHDNLKTFMRSNKFKLTIFNDLIHFNEQKFFEVLLCLKKSYSQ